MKKYPATELIRLAFIWAEQDRRTLAQAWSEKSPERAIAESQANQLRKYRQRRWGRSAGDKVDEIKTVDVKL